MSAIVSDQIGRFGELLAAVDLSRPVRRRYNRALFRATPLGEKYPIVDFIVDALAPNGSSVGFFFAQVKSTTIRPTSAKRLQIAVDRTRFNRLAAIPAPTYLIGVDVGAERSYLVAAYQKRSTAVSSITTLHGLNEDSTRIGLYKEIIAYWKAKRPLLQQTGFKDV